MDSISPDDSKVHIYLRIHTKSIKSLKYLVDEIGWAINLSSTGLWNMEPASPLHHTNECSLQGAFSLPNPCACAREHWQATYKFLYENTLTQQELFRIKQAIFECHEECWHNQMSFEAIWKKCHTVIQQGCGGVPKFQSASPQENSFVCTHPLSWILKTQTCCFQIHDKMVYINHKQLHIAKS